MYCRHAMLITFFLGIPFQSVFAIDGTTWNEVELLVADARSKSKDAETKDLTKDELLLFKHFAEPSERDLSLKLHSRRDASIEALITILQDEKLPDPFRMEAAKMLGHLRASEAVDALLENITLAPYIRSESTPMSNYPCFAALVQIGNPASRKALSQLSMEGDKRRSKLLLETVRRVEGKPVAVFLVTSELSRKKDAASKARLQAALKQLSAD